MSENLPPLPPGDYFHNLYSRRTMHAYARTACAARDARIAELEEALKGLEPHLDAIVCYASTMDEYEPNRLAEAARAALKGATP